MADKGGMLVIKMYKWRAVLLVSIVCLAFLSYPILANEKKATDTSDNVNRGTIKGVLVNENGKPVSALVTALRFEGIENNKPKIRLYYIEGRLPEDRTDSAGRFRITDLPPGKWVLRTSVGKFDKGDYIRKRSDRKVTLLVIDIENGQQVDIGKIYVNTKVSDLHNIPPSVIPLINDM
jgi:hypothetical protein